jgi:hypothetical protein
VDDRSFCQALANGNVDDKDRNQNNKAAAHGNILCITLISANPLTRRPFDAARRKLKKFRPWLHN